MTYLPLSIIEDITVNAAGVDTVVDGPVSLLRNPHGIVSDELFPYYGH